MKSFLILVGILLFTYFLVANAVFSLRHPWATDTEKMIYIGKVLSFGTVKYNDARPRD